MKNSDLMTVPEYKQLDPDYHGYLTIDEVIAYGLPYKNMPKAIPCEYCGKLTEQKGVVSFGEVTAWIDSECDCAGAQTEYAEKRRNALLQQRKIWVRQQNEIDKSEFTLSELKSKNYPLDPSKTPQALVCEYCGKTTEPTAHIVLGLVIWAPLFCGCEHGTAKYEADLAEQERKAAEEKERKRLTEQNEKIRRLLSDSGISNRFMSRTFDNFACDTPQRKKAFTEAKYYAEHFTESFSKNGTGLYIEGTFGTGKTHLAVAIALQLIGQGVNVICKTSIALFSDIKSAFKYEGEESATEKYMRCSLLVIDDLGKEQCTDWSLSKLYEIVNARYEKCKPVVITTNYSHDGLVGRLIPKGGDNVTAGALVSRLKESAIVLNMVWDDYRDVVGG